MANWSTTYTLIFPLTITILNRSTFFHTTTHVLLIKIQSILGVKKTQKETLSHTKGSRFDSTFKTPLPEVWVFEFQAINKGRCLHSKEKRHKSPLGCALALTKGNLWLSSGPMVRHNCNQRTFNVYCLFLSTKELITSEGCVEMDSPWQLCRTIGPLSLHSQEIWKWAGFYPCSESGYWGSAL